MSSSSPIAALEIGTARTVLAVGETQSSGRLKVIGHGEIPSTGVRKSQITDLAQATASVESVLHKVEQEANVSVGNALLAVSGPQIKTLSVTGSWQIDSKTVTENDVNEVREKAQETGLDETQRMILHRVEQDYSLDDQPGITNPVGMAGQLLKLRLLCIHGSSNRIEDAVHAAGAGGAKLEICDVAFAGCCAVLAVLTPRERRDGVLLIDLGGGSTSYVAYAENKLVMAGVVGVGGDHVTNDIALAFQTSNGQAEELKKAAGAAVVEAGTETKRVAIPTQTPGFDSRTISVKALETVVNARMTELFQILLAKLDESGVLHRLNAGVVLTGGGSALRDIVPLAARVFGTEVRIGLPVNVDGLEKVENPASYATIAGLLLLGQRETDATGPAGLGSITKLLRRFFA